MKKLFFTLTAVLLLAMSTPVFADEGTQTPILIDETLTQTQQEPILKDVQTISEDGQHVIIKIYDVPPSYDFTLWGNTAFEKNGYHYRQGDILQLSENYDKQTKLASQVMTVSHEEKSGIGQFVPLMDYNADGFAGQIKLDTSSISTQSAGTKSYSYAVTDTREFTGLERNDTSSILSFCYNLNFIKSINQRFYKIYNEYKKLKCYYIPKTAEKNGVSLSLKDVQWTNMGGGGYKATAQYSGAGTGSKVTGYISTANYIGEVTKSTLKNVTYKVIYEGYTLPPLSPNAMPWILGVIGFVVLIGIGILLVIYRKSVKIYAMHSGIYKVVKRQRISYLDPVVNLTATALCQQSAEYIIVIDRFAVAKLHNQFVRIICEDGSTINRRIDNDGHSCKLHISVNLHESEEGEI